MPISSTTARCAETLEPGSYCYCGRFGRDEQGNLIDESKRADRPKEDAALAAERRRIAAERIRPGMRVRNVGGPWSAGDVGVVEAITSATVSVRGETWSSGGPAEEWEPVEEAPRA